MIDAEFRSEERFSRLSLAYECDAEKDAVKKLVETVVSKYNIQPEIYTTKVSNGKEVMVIEYHDDIHRESGPIFDEIMKSLNITVCS
ncbi:MAG: hypothetical protein ABGW85_03590 [Sulfurimonas sp.]